MSELPKILFVDDDPEVLGGLRKALRKHQGRWNMVFALGGPDGLRELLGTTFDVVVSDMRMPVCDGAELLAQVCERDPMTIRMILSGFSDAEAVSRSPPIHQFLEKPCGLNELAGTIERACRIRSLFVSTALLDAIARMPDLPSVPRAYRALQALVQASERRTEVILDALDREPVLGAQILRLGSALATEPVAASMSELVARVGLGRVRDLALIAHLAGVGPIPRALVAVAARQLHPGASQAQGTNGTALLHDLGEMLIATRLPDEHAVIERRCVPGADRATIERECVGATYAELGAYLLGRWGFPLMVIEHVLEAEQR